MPLISCTDKHGVVQTFYLDDRKPRIFVYENLPTRNPNVFFEAAFELTGNSARSDVMMNHRHQCFSAKGIPEAVLEYVKDTWKVDVCSSSNQAGPTEYRTIDADKVWKRLVTARKATYSSQTDRYHLK